MLAKYISGQMEIQNKSAELEVLRGEIETIVAENGKIRVRFKWLAKTDVGGWLNCDDLNYEMDFNSSLISNIGPSPPHIGGDDRISISSKLGEFVVLLPPNGSKLDPKRVEGLRLA